MRKRKTLMMRLMCINETVNLNNKMVSPAATFNTGPSCSPDPNENIAMWALAAS